MKKVLPYLIVFVLGFVVCAWAIHHFYGSPQGFSGPQSAVNLPSFTPRIVGGSNNVVRDASKIISDYVVNIDNVGRPRMQDSLFGGLPYSSPFDTPQEVIPRGKGSGVIFSQDGYILTNNHVISGAAELIVTTNDGKQYKAKLIGTDPKTDLAVIKIDAKDLAYARFADSENVNVGDWVIAVGNALGRGTTVTIGIVSATKRGPIDIDGKSLDQVIQTDAAINPGNSGGALADLNGNLIGINTAIASTGPNGGSIGIGFAIPSDSARVIADQLVKTGKVARPYLGIRYAPLTDDIKAALAQNGFKSVPKSGVVVVEVYNGSPADKAGIKAFDVLTKIDGSVVSSLPKAEKGKVTVSDVMSKKKIGDTLDIEVMHADGRSGKLKAIIGEMPAAFLDPEAQPRTSPGIPMPFDRGFPRFP